MSALFILKFILFWVRNWIKMPNLKCLIEILQSTHYLVYLTGFTTTSLSTWTPIQSPNLWDAPSGENYLSIDTFHWGKYNGTYLYRKENVKLSDFITSTCCLVYVIHVLLCLIISITRTSGGSLFSKVYLNNMGKLSYVYTLYVQTDAEN